jgi:hypothetical protein
MRIEITRRWFAIKSEDGEINVVSNIQQNAQSPEKTSHPALRP